MGGGELAGAFQAAGLIRAYIISVIPVILGAGVPLFARHVAHSALKLHGTTPYPSGIVELRDAAAP